MQVRDRVLFCDVAHVAIVPHPARPGAGRRSATDLGRSGAVCQDLPVRAVATRVLTASVSVDEVVVGDLDRPGLLVLLGVTHTDTPDIARAMAGKLHELRILRDEQSCASVAAPLLVVSQFTLYGSTAKGRRPSWTLAAPGHIAEPLIDETVGELRRRGAEVATGIFGATMQVQSVNDGPFTLIVDL
jgi:D-tyrosyl-tRNA(Tyr) deacylase